MRILSIILKLMKMRILLGFRTIKLFATANSFIAEKNLQYQFMPAFKKDLFDFGYENFINLPELSPGVYRIGVKVKDNFDRTAETVLDFVIPSYWYETLVVRFFLVISILLLIRKSMLKALFALKK